MAVFWACNGVLLFLLAIAFPSAGYWWITVAASVFSVSIMVLEVYGAQKRKTSTTKPKPCE
jgi:phosphatidylglycerophosphate synthase